MAIQQTAFPFGDEQPGPVPEQVPPPEPEAVSPPAESRLTLEPLIPPEATTGMLFPVDPDAPAGVDPDIPQTPPTPPPTGELFLWDPAPASKPVRAPAAKGARGRKSVKELAAAADLVEIPEDEVLFQKQYYPIGEVAAMFKVNTSLIRFWETEFSDIRPRKNKK